MSKKSDLLNDYLESLPQNKEMKSRLRDCSEEEAEELRLLLKTAGDLTRYAETIKPRPQFIARIQANLEEARALKYDSRKTGIAGVFKPVARWAVSGAIAAVMALFTFTGGFALANVASKNTMPGQPLYPVKQVVEKVKVALDLPGSREPNQFERARTGETSDATKAAPGQQSLVDNGKESAEKANNGKSESAPGQQSPPDNGTGTGEKTNNGKSESAPGQQSPPDNGTGTGEKANNGKSESAPGQQSAADNGKGSAEKANHGKSE